MTHTPTEAEILSDVSTILNESLGVLMTTPIDRETRFFADLGLASIDAIVLAEALQNHFNRSLPFGELMAELGSREDRDLAIGELIDFLHKHLNSS